MDWQPYEYFETVAIDRDGPAARIELRRPEVLNAWDHRLPGELLRALRAVAADPGLRAVMITGAGRGFTAGADLNSSVMRNGPEGIMRSLREETNEIILAVRRMPKLVIGAVNGPAAGVGCSLALACDLVVAAESALFLLPFTRIGLTLDGGSSLLVAARVGFGRASRMALLAESVSASDAYAWGMVDELTSDAEHRATAEALLATAAAGPTAAYAMTKQNLNAALFPDLEAHLEREALAQEALLSGHDYAEGVAAFTERRVPAFTGS
jgi:enoyl-CoA hydratase/carnithine racemase